MNVSWASILVVVGVVACAMVSLARSRGLARVVLILLAVIATPFVMRWVSHSGQHQAFEGNSPPEFVLRNEDYDDWQRDSAIASGVAPQWVTSGSGVNWTHHGPGFEIKSRWPSHGTLVGYSGLEFDPKAAREGALESASAQLATILFEGICDPQAKDGTHRGELPQALRRSGVELREVYRVCLEKVHRLLASTPPLQEFSQSVDRKYGELHRAAVLIPATGPRLQEHRRRAQEAIGALVASRKVAHREIIYTSVSALGLALVILVLYVFLNAGTKGHFAWPLRCISVAALALLYFGMFYLKGWLPGWGI